MTGGAAGRTVGQVTVTPEVWVVGSDQRFEGPAPAPELATAIVALARRVAGSRRPLREDVEIGDGRGGRSTVRLTARASGTGVVVASLLLGELREVEDVDDERVATAALKASEERLRRIMSSATDQVFWLANRENTAIEYVS